jgi:long-subunit acyl-CoA synthetase (AMP-forming)
VLLQVVYGMTETSPLSFMAVPDESPEMQVSTVGCILDYVEVNIFFLLKFY